MNRFPATYKNPEPESVITDVSDSGTHSDLVLNWRKEEFERMGFVSYVAALLAHGRIDLHQMETLLDKGCPHDLALQILTGTMWSGDDPLTPYYEEDQVDERERNAA